MNSLRVVRLLRSHGCGWLVGLAVALVSPAAFAQAAPAGKVVGLSSFGRNVSNLETAVKFYQALDFKLQGKPSDWRVDEVANQLSGTKGAESRTAVMTVQSSVADIPFKFVLREFRGIDRANWTGLSSSDLLSGHLDLTVLDDCNPWLDKLKSLNLLKMPEMNMAGSGDANGPRRFVFVQDPDGWFIELFALMKPVPGAPPEEPKVSNSSATFSNIDRVGKQAGFNHLGLNIINPDKALAFYQGVLGGDYPPLTPAPAAAPRSGGAGAGTAASGGGNANGSGASARGGAAAGPRMNMMNGWFPQAGTERNVRVELIGFPQADCVKAPAMKFADIGVTYAGFQVQNLDAVYARVKAAGATSVSDGIVKTADGRAVLIRDPDVGGFVELWEPAR